MSDYTATCYGIGDSRKGGFKTSSALKNELSTMSKGQKTMRFVIAAGSQIMGGEIYVNKDTVLANGDTLTLTVTTG
jgi:hypothetical protein